MAYKKVNFNFSLVKKKICYLERYDFTIFYEYALYSKEKTEFPTTYSEYLEMNKVPINNLKI